MSKKLHPADDADREAVGRATSFNVHIRRSPTSKINEPAATLERAIEIADRLAEDYPGKRPLIYALLPDNVSVPVPQAMIDAARSGGRAEGKAPEKAKDRKSASPKVKVAAEAKAPAIGKRQAALDAAMAGTLPTPPDFTAPTHARFRKKLDQVVEMVKAGDIAGLRAFEIKPVSTSPRAIARYRDLAVMALEATTKQPDAEG